MSSTLVNPVITDELVGQYTLDPAHSRVGFSARHAMVSKVRGNFTDYTAGGELGETGNGSIQVEIKTESINTGNTDRDTHLKSEDFFNAIQYPTITFKSTRVTRTVEGIAVDGDLTIKDITRPVSFTLEHTGTAVDPWGQTRVGLEGGLTVNRKDWGLTWNVALEAGGILVSDKVNIELELSAIKSA